MATVLLVGTCDTKLEELLYVRRQIELTDGVGVILVDVGRTSTEHESISIPQTTVVSHHVDGTDVSALPRADFIRYMTSCLSSIVDDLRRSSSIHGIVGLGGSGGTSLLAPVMRDALPIGFPKMIVSTIASGDVGSIVGETDITMMYSVVDIAGMNEVMRDVLANAGAAIGAAAFRYEARHRQDTRASPLPDKKRVGITMFGVTTPAVDKIRQRLVSRYGVETYVFHATGHGGKAMERLVREGKLHAVLDLTTTEICDFVAGGVMSAGPTRLDAAVEAGIPTIVSLGATDMVNFGPMSSVPERYKDRKLYEHNPVVTLMRSSTDECHRIGRFVCEKLTRARDPNIIEVWIPKGGVSLLSKPGGPFEDAEADDALFDEIRDGLRSAGIRVVEDHRDINDPGFAEDITEALARKMGLKQLI